jgi:hypothetical protein
MLSGENRKSEKFQTTKVPSQSAGWGYVPTCAGTEYDTCVSGQSRLISNSGKALLSGRGRSIGESPQPVACVCVCVCVSKLLSGWLSVLFPISLSSCPYHKYVYRASNNSNEYRDGPGQRLRKIVYNFYFSILCASVLVSMTLYGLCDDTYSSATLHNLFA